MRRDSRSSKRTLRPAGAPHWLFTTSGSPAPPTIGLSGVSTLAELDAVIVDCKLDLCDSDLPDPTSRFKHRRGASGFARIPKPSPPDRTMGASRISGEISTTCGANTNAVTKRCRVLQRRRESTDRSLETAGDCPVHDTRGFAKPEVTAGGVAPPTSIHATMLSRHGTGVVIAGEVLDVDGWIGRLKTFKRLQHRPRRRRAASEPIGELRLECRFFPLS